jgi:hypothetical protein
MELLGMLIIESGVAGLTGFVLYHTIIKPKREDTASALTIGFGLVLPFWIAWPVILIQLFDIRNTILKFTIGCIVPTLSIFRTTEAVFGFAPSYATQSAWDYVFYYGSVMLYARDKTGILIRCTFSKLVESLGRFILFLFITGAVQSIISRKLYDSIAVANN